MKRILFAVVLSLLLCACAAHTEEEIVKSISDSPNTAMEAVPSDMEIFDSISMHSVDSSCFSMIGYSDQYEALAVQFRDSGSEYLYANVSRDEYEALDSATSIGQYYNSAIKGNYPCVRIR